MSLPQKRDHDDDNASIAKRQHVEVCKEPSIFNLRPMDDITKRISDFIAKYTGRDNVEIEAKFGIFIDKQSSQRIYFECETETVIPHYMSRQSRFESNMPLAQHEYYNKLLNERVNRSQSSSHRGERIKYRHTREIDQFYKVDNQKHRVTIDQKTREVVPNGIVEKVRLENLDIHSPLTPLDFRISANLEIPRPQPQGRVDFERHKDRLSYQHGGLTFDLTQVKGGPVNDTELRHELEIEFVDCVALHEEHVKMERGEPSNYVALVERFVNNIRLLAKHAKKMA
ncbi:CYTH-like domain-containing protein [Gongronella butleri]|nr:CYTH-like domain-containing protein [Gongronella butleri]